MIQGLKDGDLCDRVWLLKRNNHLLLNDLNLNPRPKKIYRHPSSYRKHINSEHFAQRHKIGLDADGVFHPDPGTENIILKGGDETLKR